MKWILIMLAFGNHHATLEKRVIVGVYADYKDCAVYANYLNNQTSMFDKTNFICGNIIG